MSVHAYCKKKGIKTPQIIYNKIAMNRMGKVKWREVEKKVKLKQVFYED